VDRTSSWVPLLGLHPALPGSDHRHDPEYLLVHPLEKRVIQLQQLLTGNMGEYRTALPFIHQIPHGGNRRHSPPLVGYLGLIGYEVELPAPVVEAALLDLMAAHVLNSLAGFEGRNRDGAAVRTRVSAARQEI
jgi:hypothetical protein